MALMSKKKNFWSRSGFVERVGGSVEAKDEERKME